MIVKKVLNNYQLGSYPYNVLSNNIILQERLNDKHTLVKWEVNNSELQLLKKVFNYLYDEDGKLIK